VPKVQVNRLETSLSLAPNHWNSHGSGDGYFAHTGMHAFSAMYFPHAGFQRCGRRSKALFRVSVLAADANPCEAALLSWSLATRIHGPGILHMYVNSGGLPAPRLCVHVQDSLGDLGEDTKISLVSGFSMDFGFFRSPRQARGAQTDPV
jgi:hypothetical protein